MPIKIIHASIAENGAIEGKPGDQTGAEVETRTYFKRDWKSCLRCLDPSIADRVVQCATDGANNPHIGYGQYSRNSAYTAYKAVNSIAKINTDCNTDCSAFVALCVKAAGIPCDITNAPTTYNLADWLTGTGLFVEITDERFLTSDAYLLPGDILINPGVHCVICAEGGLAAYNKTMITESLPRDFDESAEGYYTTTANVYMRTDAGTSYPVMTAVPPKTGELYCSGGYSLSGRRRWYYVSFKKDCILYTGFISSLYIKKGN